MSGHRIAPAFLPLFAALMLAGCATVGPDYQGAESVSPLPEKGAAPFVSTGKGPFRSEPLPDAWWRLYEDPLLDRLVQEALAANTDLRLAAARIDQARALLSGAEAGRRVQTDVAGGLSLSRGNQRGGDQPVVAGYDGAISLSYEVDLVGRLRRLIEASSADVEAAEAAQDLVRITVIAQVADAYAAVCAASYQRQSVMRSLSVQEASLKATERLVRAGRGTALDRSRSAMLVAQYRALLPDYDAARDNGLFRLAVLLGRVPGDYPTKVADCAQPLRVTETLPVGDGAALIRRRPDIREAERAIAAATARIGVAMADLYPSVQLGGSAGLGGPVSGIGSSGSIGFLFGPLISWRFPDRTAVRARIAEAQASEQAAIARFDGLVLNALGEVEMALTSYARQLERHRALQQAQGEAAKALAQVRQLRKMGRESTLAVLDAERASAAAGEELAASEALLSRHQVRLFLALGGGWSDPTQKGHNQPREEAGQEHGPASGFRMETSE